MLPTEQRPRLGTGRTGTARTGTARRGAAARTRDERGVVSILMAAVAMGLCLVALAAADLGAMVLARARAQAAADGAALAAAIEQAPILGQGDDPEAAARDYAHRNGATLIRCDCRVGSAVTEVEVTVRPRVLMIAAWQDRPAHATARATIDEAVFTYREARP